MDTKMIINSPLELLRAGQDSLEASSEDHLPLSSAFPLHGVQLIYKKPYFQKLRTRFSKLKKGGFISTKKVKKLFILFFTYYKKH